MRKQSSSELRCIDLSGGHRQRIHTQELWATLAEAIACLP